MRVGCAIGKTEEKVAHNLMAQLKERGHPDAPPPMATDGKGDYRSALVDTCGQVPDYAGRGRLPTLKQPYADWQYQVGGHTSYVERANLTARQMNGRLVRKTLSYSKELEALEAACAWEDWIYNLTRTVDMLAIPDRDEQGHCRWQR